jgi:hypothetical protein
MPELIRHWPRELSRVLDKLHPVNGRAGCFAAEVDLSEDEIRHLNLFEASSRHEHVAFTLPATAEECFAYLNTPIGLGAPHQEGCVGRVRVSLTDVRPH